MNHENKTVSKNLTSKKAPKIDLNKSFLGVLSYKTCCKNENLTLTLPSL
jgi:hypothetical protein